MQLKKENQLNNKRAYKVNMSANSWLISKYSRKYSTDIIVFNPFRLRKSKILSNEIALNS